MSGEGASVEEALSRRCIADTSLLNNFVHSGSAYLLDRLLRGPVRLSPVVLDIGETLLPAVPQVEPASEFLKPLWMSRYPEHATYRGIAPFIQDFALSAGELWEPAEPGKDELALAAYFSSKRVRADVQDKCPRIRRTRVELHPGEAEAAAIAVSRGWTFLTEDQASVELVQCLYPEVPVLRTCSLLMQAVKQGYLSCEEAADLFNQRIVDELGLWVYRRSDSKRERLWLRCKPLKCVWE